MCGIPLSNLNQVGLAWVMSSVQYTPQSVPANTWDALFGLTITESTGMSGRLPVLFAHVNEPQFDAHVTWKTWPGCDGVFALKPPTAA